MTRHGTLAYYLAAWVIGSSSVAIMLWIISTWGAGGESPSASIFLRIDFLALIFGWPGAIAFAFLLRRVMHWWKTQAVWKWVLVGAWLALAPVLLLVPVYERFSRSMDFNPGSPGFLLALVIAGPGLLSHSGLWQVPIEGAATAAVLCLVDRAFDRPEEAGDAKPTAV